MCADCEARGCAGFVERLPVFRSGVLLCFLWPVLPKPVGRKDQSCNVLRHPSGFEPLSTGNTGSCLGLRVVRVSAALVRTHGQLHVSNLDTTCK